MTRQKRSGRMSLRFTPDFLDLCAATASARGLTLTEFTQQSLMLNITRKPMTMADMEELLLKVATNG